MRCGPPRRVSEFEAFRVLLIHRPVGDFGCHVGIYKNHVSHSEAGRFDDRFHSVEREIHLKRGIGRHVAGFRIAAGHRGHEKLVLRQHPRRIGFAQRETGDGDGARSSEIADGDRRNLHTRLSQLRYAQNSPSRRIFWEIGSKDFVRFA